MPGVERQPGETLESLLRRFRRSLSLSGQLQEYRRKQHYASPGEARRQKMRKSLRRLRRRERRTQGRGSRRHD